MRSGQEFQEETRLPVGGHLCGISMVQVLGGEEIMHQDEIPACNSLSNDLARVLNFQKIHRGHTSVRTASSSLCLMNGLLFGFMFPFLI